MNGLLAWTLVLASVAPVAQAGAEGDPYRDRQWALDRVQAPQAWQTSTGKGTLIAVLDTGVDLGHPDLETKLVTHSDADFWDCPVPGYPAERPPCTDPDGPQDVYNHGTGVAGIAAASTGNGIGIAGVASRAKLMPVRIVGPTDADSPDANFPAAIDYATEHRADIINVSVSKGNFGFADFDGQAPRRAWRSGAVLVAASGEGAADSCLGYPARRLEVICVGGVDIDDQPTVGGTDFALRKNFVVAPAGGPVAHWAGNHGDGFHGFGGQRRHPGECADYMISTWLFTTNPERSRDCPLEGGAYGYIGISTGLAAASVSGIAALLAAQGLDNCQIVDRILGTADDLGAPGRDPVFGYGRVNAHRAVTNQRNGIAVVLPPEMSEHCAHGPAATKARASE